MSQLLGKHAVITGGGSGVGAELARVFSRAGAEVTILGRSVEPLEAVAAETGAYPASVDVTDAVALKKVMTDRPAVDIAIANAGAAISKPFGKMTPDDWQSMLSVNLIGVANLWQAALPSMQSQGWGRLIAIASTAGLKGYPYVAGYSAAKHGVVGLTRSLALELGKTNITANAICPGFIDTPMLARSIENIVEKTGMSDADAAKTLCQGNPQGRFIETDEVAETALWLCSEAARSINGHALSISGGEI